jgi:hypothetical protein
MRTHARVHRTAAFGVTLLVGMLGACTSSSADESSQKTSQELRRFYEQELTFEPCEPYASNETDAKLFANLAVSVGVAGRLSEVV